MASDRNVAAPDAWRTADPKTTLDCTGNDRSPAFGWPQEALRLVNPGGSTWSIVTAGMVPGSLHAWTTD
jgi:hypothetical protein